MRWAKCQKVKVYFTPLAVPQVAVLNSYDDFLIHSFTNEDETKAVHEILNKRQEANKSTIVCSQRMPHDWRAQILDDEVAADAIMKRATKHYTVMINLKEEK